MKKLENKHLKLCALRLVVRTSGFHPGNRGSIPLGRTKLKSLRSLSSVGRAPALQAGGHWFEPSSDHHLRNIWFSYMFKAPCGGVAQLVRALACHARGRGFEPRHSRQQFNICAALAHLVEQLTCNQQVVGSNPTSGTILFLVRFPSGQRDQTVNLTATPSKVRILLSPPFFLKKF